MSSWNPIRPGRSASTQSELSIAVDSTGHHSVVGMKGFRGALLNPVKSSGFSSDDAGATFHDGGQLPVSAPTKTLSGQIYPQVFGDPEVKDLGGSTFVDVSIIVAPYGANGLVQTLGVHRSTDFGQHNRALTASDWIR